MNIFSNNEASAQARQEGWYLVQCKPRQDARAEEHLIRQGYQCVRPVCTRRHFVRGQYQSFSESLFPGYLFINLPDEANWAPLRSTRGVSRIVCFGGKPLAVSFSLVEQLQERAKSEIESEFKLGDKVFILDSRFAELDAIFMSKDGEERAILLINFLSRQQQISLPLASIAAS